MNQNLKRIIRKAKYFLAIAVIEYLMISTLFAFMYLDINKFNIFTWHPLVRAVYAFFVVYSVGRYFNEYYDEEATL